MSWNVIPAPLSDADVFREAGAGISVENPKRDRESRLMRDHDDK